LPAGDSDVLDGLEECAIGHADFGARLAELCGGRDRAGEPWPYKTTGRTGNAVRPVSCVS